MRLVVKIGSQAILSPNGKIRKNVMDNLVKQILALQNKGIKVVLVSSGAVALGRINSLKISKQTYDNSVADKQLLASIGQVHLMALYARICERLGIMASQILLTKYDFQTRRSYINISRLLNKALMQPKVLVIINENDSISVDDLVFTDNDELAGIIAAQIDADKLVLLTTVNGVYDRNPTDKQANLIPIINMQDQMIKTDSAKTDMGRGGMLSKLTTARKAAKIGVTTHIAHAHEKDVLLRLILNNEQIGTKVIPSKHKSSLKRYLAFGSKIVEAEIKVNSCLAELLKEESKSLSILPVGITKVKGEFKAGDLINILDSKGEKIAIGVARYNQQKLNEYIGKHHAPMFIHYNSLYVY